MIGTIKRIPPPEPMYEITLTITERERGQLRAFFGSVSPAELVQKIYRTCTVGEADALLDGLCKAFTKSEVTLT